MNTTYEIIPSPGTMHQDWPSLEKKIQLVKPFAKTIHLDIVDGKFADNITFADPDHFAKYTKEFFFEVHLMVDEPLQYLKPFAEAGFKRFIGQIEKMSDQVEFVAQGQLLGEVGLAVDGKTSIDSVKVPLDDLDCILIMMINAGFSGQAFTPEHLEKVRYVRSKSQLPIEVDGGINLDTIKAAKETGVNRFVVTSAIFNQPDPHQAYLALQEAIK